MVQTTIRAFMSPPTNRSIGQSQSTPPPGQSSPNANHEGESRELPKRVGKKAKKCQRQEHKRERKRAKLHRKCKNNSWQVDPGTPNSTVLTPDSGTPKSTAHTPMPSPGDKSAQGLLDSGDTNSSILFGDRSLTEMLCSDVTESGDRTHTSNCESNSEAILRLEAQVLAANIELHGVKGLPLDCFTSDWTTHLRNWSN